MTTSSAPRVRWWIPAFILAGLSAVVLSVMNPGLLVSSTTPTGGDMGAHVLGPAYMRDVLLPQGRVMGWSQAWFAGFPAFYFYFPLPSLVIVFLDLFLPYGVAFKVVTVLGLIGTPPAAYYLARSLKLGRIVSSVAAASGVVFVFLESYTIYGANVASTLAGEFSFSWSFAFSLLYMGSLIRGLRDDRKYLVWAGVFLGLTALCHVITTIVIVLASIPVLFWRRGWRTILVWMGGFALAGFWALPLLARIGYTSDMAWTPLNDLAEILPPEMWLLLPLAIVGAILMARRTQRVIPVAAFTLLPVIYFPLPATLHQALPEIFTEERWKLWNGRLLPYWYFGVAFLAAIAVGFAARWIMRQLPERASVWWPRALVALAGVVAYVIAAGNQDTPPWLAVGIGVAAIVLVGITFLFRGRVLVRSVVTSAAAGVLALGALAGVNFVDGWARWNYEGYERKGSWEEYQALMATISELPDGRVLWEPDSREGEGLGKYGTPMSPMLIPYWTQWRFPSVEGLFFESSLTTPFHFILAGEMARHPSNPIPGLQYHNFAMDRGVKHMDLYGVRYYVAYNEEAADKASDMAELAYVTESPPFTIFERGEQDLVEVATHQPAVYGAPDGGIASKILAVFGAGSQGPTFNDLAFEWYENIDLIDRWVVADGPDSWPRVDSLDELPDEPLDVSGEVSDVVVDDHRISFRTTAVGVPHLVKVSYFPNWVAEGAAGPYHAAPSLMVVVPEQEEVVIEFRHRLAEWVGIGLSVSAVVALAVFGLSLRRRGSDGYATDPSESAEPA